MPVSFTLPRDAEVTLVIDDLAGHRVRNLLSAAPFSRGRHTVYWDGSTDTERDLDAAMHGIYNIPSRLVPAGDYLVRGLEHQPVDLLYEFSVNSAGTPPWPTPDGKGGWTTNHTPPSSVLFLPGSAAPGGEPLVYIGSHYSEGGAALAWVDLQGRKQGGRGWIGGNWTGGQYLARDAGPAADSSIYAYVGAVFSATTSQKEAEVRLTGLRRHGEDRAILRYTFQKNQRQERIEDLDPALGGLAVRDGLIVFSQTSYDQIIAVSAPAGEIVGRATLPSPRGLAFDPAGRLLILTSTQLLRFPPPAPGPFGLGAPEIAIRGLDDPAGITVRANGDIFISEHGTHHQVLRFTSSGRLVQSFGRPGPPSDGPYHPDHMNNPRGLAVDSNGRLWVAEEDFQPKRVSVWNPDGSLWKAFYGPPRYGGGGTIDSQDKTRFDYDGMEFRLNWGAGTSQLERILHRTTADDQVSSWGEHIGFPTTPFYLRGNRYLTNAFTQDPTNGAGAAFIFLDHGDAAVPVAGMGSAKHWKLLHEPRFRSRWPASGKVRPPPPDEDGFFIWNDLNGDGRVDPDEVSIYSNECDGVTVEKDGAFIVGRMRLLSGKSDAMQFKPVAFSAGVRPVYDFSAGTPLVRNVNARISTGGGQVMVAPNGWTVLTTAPPPFSPAGLGGVFQGQPRWSYPSVWPGLHASHSAPLADTPGELIGTTRLLGDFIVPRHSDAGPMFFINGNLGNIYAFTADGLFVSAFFQDRRVAKLWSMPVAQRGMRLNDLTPGDEQFFPSVTQTADGSIYFVAGNIFSSIVRVQGLESARRLGPWPLHVTAQDIRLAEDFVTAQEMRRQRSAPTTDRLDAPILAGRSASPPPNAAVLNWVDLDHRGVAAFFNAGTKPYSVRATFFIANATLVARWETGDPLLLANSGQLGNLLFRTGGALDLVLGTDGQADPKRLAPVAGDLRLLVAQVGGKTKAFLYRPVVPGTAEAQKVRFSSPGRTVVFDRVDEVSESIGLTTDGRGGYELSIPLTLIGLDPKPGMRIQADLGILRGDGNSTKQRIYWHNKATAIMADIPSEAMLTPGLWGTAVFEPPTAP